VVLIDEADVSIRRRDDNMAANAVVGVFLRVLEYFNGLLFLTTNRVDDIDEAIVSRCIALIKYEPPDRGARAKIWRVRLEQFELREAAVLIPALIDLFSAATGPDIKGLAKLVAKYCRQKKTFRALEIFKRRAVFRALEFCQPSRDRRPGSPTQIEIKATFLSFP
jgi:SpoVK/Ycf46/Vps4 family AAA+-type ATPase